MADVHIVIVDGVEVDRKTDYKEALLIAHKYWLEGKCAFLHKEGDAPAEWTNENIGERIISRYFNV